MEISIRKPFTQAKNSFFSSPKFFLCLYLLLLSLVLVYVQLSTYDSCSSSPPSASLALFNRRKEAVTIGESVRTNQSEVDVSVSARTPDPVTFRTNDTNVNVLVTARTPDLDTFRTNHSEVNVSVTARMPGPVTFLPLKDVRFSDPEAAMSGHTWFMSSINDTSEENEAQYLLFPSVASEGRVLCIKGRDTRDGTKNSYAMAHPGSLPDSAIFMKGLTYVSSTYYNHKNLWHALSALGPFVRWSMKNECIKPTRSLLYHWGESNFETGSWIQKLMEANYREMNIEKLDRGNGPYCFEKAVVMRHDFGKMSKENRLKVYDLLRCKAREFCGFNPAGRGKEVNERGVPIIRMTLLMRRGSRSFKDPTAVFEVFSRECAKVDGCILEMIQVEDLTSFCDQVKVMMNTDILASPHGAQQTNMFFMERESSVMEFYPKGWIENAGVGQYVYHWLADTSGMKHRGAWWDSVGEECPNPKDRMKCFSFYKDGKVGHNATYFAEWTSKVLGQVRISKQQQLNSTDNFNSNASCVC